MMASIESQSSTWLPSMSITASPRRTPRQCSQFPTRSERAAISSKENRAVVPSSSAITRAGRLLPRAIASNQSTPQLKVSPTSGHSNPATASA